MRVAAVKSQIMPILRYATEPSVQRRYAEVIVGGLKTACLTRAQLAALMVNDCLAARLTGCFPKLVFTANGHSIALAATDAEFRRYLDEADVIHADGQPAVLASRWLTRSPIPERSATTDFFHDATVAARTHGLRVFLFGGSEDVNACCAQIVREMYPGLQITGRRNGYFSPGEEAVICQQINASGADIVWVSLGVPLEQAFCTRNKHRLRAGWLITSGGCFNFVTGDYTRAPQWMQNIGLEWLYRVWKEPRRLIRRYAVTNPRALFLLLTRTGSILPATATLQSQPAEP